MHCFKYFSTLLLTTFTIFVAGATPLFQASLTGKVTDITTGEPVIGATVYIPDLKTGGITDVNGIYSITGLPLTRLRIQVTCVGYKMISRIVDLTLTSTIDFQVEESVSELSEIVVTGLSQAGEKNRTPTPVTTIPPIQLQQQSAHNIIDAITLLPGINQITTGAAISKPVIRGLGFNRVVVINDGIRQEGQQWGDEHGIEIDGYAVDHVEVLKGPATLMYGSDAMAGVINFMSAPTLAKGTINGKLLANYQTNNDLIGYSLNIAGNKNDFIWDARWSQRMAHAYQNRYDDFVYNSGFAERTLSGIAGINKSWGYSHLHFSSYFMKPGIIEGERDSLTGAFVKPVALNDSVWEDQLAAGSDFKSYTPRVPFQEINHYKLVLNNNFVMGDGSLKAIVGWQQNRRKEFGDILNPDGYGLYFLLNTFNYDLRYIFPEKKGLNFSVGLNGMYQDSQNKGIEYLVPEYNLFDAGVYAVAMKSYNKLDISGGLRFDMRQVAGDDLFLDAEGRESDPVPGASRKFTAFDSDFSGISGSLGATYQLSEILYTKLNLSRGFRAPNIAELGSNGEHEGSGRFEIGDPDLEAENSLQVDYTFGIHSGHITGEVNLFSNTISNFIFISRLSNSQGLDSLSDGRPVYNFTSGKANLSGGEINIDIHPHPLDWLHFENSFSYVKGVQLNQPDSSKYLPFIPAAKYTSVLKATVKKINKRFHNGFVKAGFDYYFKQDNIYAINNTETPTGSYSLVNIGAGTDVIYKNRTLLTVYVSINNLLDAAYQNHLSRLKYAPENYATGRPGVFEMGRNISFKIIVPFGIQKSNIK